MKLTGENRRTRRKTCPSATLSTTNPTWTDPGLRGERPATNRLSHGTANNRNYLLHILFSYSLLQETRFFVCVFHDYMINF